MTTKTAYKGCQKDSGKHIEDGFSTSSNVGLAGTALARKPNHTRPVNLHLLFSSKLFVSSAITMTWRFHLCLQKKEKEKKLIQRENSTEMIFISLLTAVMIQKGKLLPVFGL